MKYKLLLLFSISLSLNLAAQMRISITSPQDLPNLIPGYSEVTTVNTQILSFKYTLPPSDPDPVDGDTLTEHDDILKYGESLPVSYTLNHGNYTQTSQGNVWTFSIKLLGGAKNIGISFDSVNLSANAEFYVYNESKTELLGPIKRDYFEPYSRITTVPCKDSMIYVYVIERNNFSSFQSTFSIKKIIAGFIDLDGSDNARTAGTGCMTSVQCFQDKMPVAHAVCAIYEGGHQATGTLINNESTNGRPFLLTAFHLIDINGDNQLSADELAEINGTTVLFRYWKDYCGASTYNSGIFFSGAVLRAAWKSKGGSDMALLELTNHPGIGDGVTYAGWNRNNDAPPDNTSFIIHHPSGKDMRLTKTTNVRSFLFDNDYWQAFYQDNSAVTRGSSGGALFDANNRIAGQLYKGWTSCLTSGYSDRYGKFSSSWNGGGTLDTRLSDWLSPNQMLLTTDLFDPTTVAIVGSDIISCTNNTQYSLNYNLFDVSYVWEWSSNIQYVSGQGTPTLTVSPLPGSNTQGFIKVTITSIKGISRSLVRTKTVYSGPPTISASYNYNGNVVPMQIYSGSSSFNPVCNLQQTNTAMQISGASSVYWSKLTSNPTSVSWTQNGNDLSFYLWSLGQTAVFRIEATNICGTASYDFGFQSVNCGSGGGGCAKYAVTNGDKSTLRVVVPNIPAPCRLASMNKDSSRKEEIIEWVKIYDMSGRLRIHQKFADTKSATVNTFSLLPGVYIIEISDGKNIERQKVVIIK